MEIRRYQKAFQKDDDEDEDGCLLNQHRMNLACEMMSWDDDDDLMFDWVRVLTSSVSDD